MSLRQKLGLWIAGHSRASTPAIGFEPPSADSFGPGIGNQPQSAVLLNESQGVVDTATRAVANRLASLRPLVKVQRRVTGGTFEEEILDDHPLAKLLARPHPNISWRQLMRVTGQWMVTVGESYWLKVGNGLGLPMELHPIPPTMIQPLVRRGIVNGYRITTGSGRQEVLPPEVVCRFYFPDPENPWGAEGYLGPLGIAADTHKFASQHLRRHYQKDATPKTAFEAQAEAAGFSKDQIQEMHRVWGQAYNGRTGDRVGLPVVLPTGYRLVQLAMQTGADMAPLLEYFRDDILMGIGTPRSVLGQVVSGDRSSAETNQYVFDRHTVEPIAEVIADGLTLQLARDFEGDVFVAFDEFVAPDKQFQLQQEQSDLDRKVRSINQVLTDRGEDEVDWGDELLMKKGEMLLPPDEAGRPEPPPGGPPQAGGDAPDMTTDSQAEEDVERSLHIAIRKLFREKRRGKAA